MPRPPAKLPIKSNAAFELYQGQCVVLDGLVVEMSFLLYPYYASSLEGKRFREIGETAYLALFKRPVTMSGKSTSKYFRPATSRLRSLDLAEREVLAIGE